MPNQNQILDDNRSNKLETYSLSPLLIAYIAHYIVLFGMMLLLSFLEYYVRLDDWIEVLIYLVFMLGSPVLNGWLLYYKKRLKAPQAFTSGFFLFFISWFFGNFLFPIAIYSIFPLNNTLILELPQIFVHFFHTTPASLDYYMLFCLCFFYMASSILGLLIIHLIFKSSPHSYR